MCYKIYKNKSLQAETLERGSFHHQHQISPSEEQETPTNLLFHGQPLGPEGHWENDSNTREQRQLLGSFHTAVLTAN